MKHAKEEMLKFIWKLQYLSGRKSKGIRKILTQNEL